MASRFIGGLHSVRAALKHPGKVKMLWIDGERHDRRLRELIDAARSVGIRPSPVPKEELERLLPDTNHQGAVAEIEGAAAGDEHGLEQILGNLSEPAFLLVLDGVQDPHNLGACLRSADGAGVHAVIAPRDKSVGLTPVAAKVASGAADNVPFIQVTNLARALKRLADEHGIWIVGLAGEAETSLYDTDLKGPLALVMGGEGEGMRRLTREHCDRLASLPMKGSVESLNVSVATGIALFEAVRQRG
ncbi:MAG: 23S rRNA (guanosine(2251)-2'-O)-methyltransferase RlmB [Gammaproteobacteria bacterium RIFOXYA12_FULL_61_12]|nr:MAG: 23S rRNA (guanosine(2251)-2'-O)-methyltransferase RlmB [Gammaproteobacteria bacterium RIFOXYD12_FULL_61_37]OGT93452.1 MAG: 23S rRNA (guanosine(2251)-2'-O)-methyltransferase RlmB [Gammaproteobacteria bacterium RIFOXYA12_FULL_61_12]